MKNLPPTIRQETWLELDDVKRTEYEQALRGGVTKLERLSDQVSRIHIFALLTKLKQICNFAGDQDSSPKTKL